MLFNIFRSLSGKKRNSSRAKRQVQHTKRLRFETLEARAMLSLPTGIESTELFQLGYLDVTAYASVDSTGIADSTAGLQEAIDDAFDNRMATYFPQGTYTISDTLRLTTYQLWNSALGRSNVPKREPNVLVGEASGGNRPLLQLSENAPLFNDVTTPRPMVIFRNFRAIDDRGVTEPAVLPFNPIAIPAGFESNRADLYVAEVKNLDFDLNENAGAAGLFMTTAQDSSIENVRIDATGGYTGFWGLPGTSSGGAVNIEVEGGQYGVLLDSPSSPASTVIVGARLYRQTDAAIFTTIAHPTTVVGFDIVKDSGPVVTIQPNVWSTSSSLLTLLDGKIDIGDGSMAIDNGSGRTFYMRNVYVTGTDQLIQSGNEAIVTATGTWKQIEEYAYTDQINPPGDPPYEVGDVRFRSFSVIDGVVSRTPEPVTSVVSNSSAPPADLIARHVWTNLVSISDGDTNGDGIGEFMNVIDYGATPEFDFSSKEIGRAHV